MGALLLLKAATATRPAVRRARRIAPQTTRHKVYRMVAALATIVPAPMAVLRYLTGGLS
jgi:hypothetical protein